MDKKLSFAKSIDADKKLISGYVSTFDYDRDQERFVKGAWDFSHFLKNPVVLWAHDSSQPPIAKNVDLKEDEFGVFGISEFNPKSERSMEIFSLFENKFLNAFSVGFLRKDYQVVDIGGGQQGLDITKAELYEYSAVTVPANAGALVSREVATLAIKTLGENVIEVIRSKSLGEQFLVLPASDPKEPEAVPTLDSPAQDLEPVLKNLLELAKVAKGSPLSETKRGLMVTAMSVFNELLSEVPAELSIEDLKRLKDALCEFASIVGEQYPQAAPSIQKTISQIEKAVTGRQG